MQSPHSDLPRQVVSASGVDNLAEPLSPLSPFERNRPGSWSGLGQKVSDLTRRRAEHLSQGAPAVKCVCIHWTTGTNLASDMLLFVCNRCVQQLLMMMIRCLYSLYFSGAAAAATAASTTQVGENGTGVGGSNGGGSSLSGRVWDSASSGTVAASSLFGDIGEGV